MKSPHANEAQFAVCVNDDGYPASLELHKIYRIVPDEGAVRDGDLRVVDESGEDYLYPVSYFSPIVVSAELEASLLTAT